VRAPGAEAGRTKQTSRRCERPPACKRRAGGGQGARGHAARAARRERVLLLVGQRRRGQVPRHVARGRGGGRAAARPGRRRAPRLRPAPPACAVKEHTARHCLQCGCQGPCLLLGCQGPSTPRVAMVLRKKAVQASAPRGQPARRRVREWGRRAPLASAEVNEADELQAGDDADGNGDEGCQRPRVGDQHRGHRRQQRKRRGGGAQRAAAGRAVRPAAGRVRHLRARMRTVTPLRCAQDAKHSPGHHVPCVQA